MQTAPHGLFYGWLIVTAATAIIATGMGLMDSLGVFMEPLETTSGRGRGQIGRASLVCWLVSGLSSFRRRARAVAITNCSAALGSMLVAPLTRYLIERCDGQTAFGLYALLAWLIMLPLAWLIRNRPEEMGLRPLGHPSTSVSYAPSTPDPANWAFREVLAQPSFWIIAVVNFCCCAAHSSPLFHMESAAIDAGVGKLATAAVFAVISLSSIPARLITGLLADRYGTKTVLVTWLFMQALVVLL